MKTCSLISLLFLCVSAVNADEEKRIALVFDDGPTEATAVRLLQVLEKEKVTVSFAQVASAMERHTNLSLITKAKGHEIVNHSYGHRNVDELDDEELKHEISGAQKTMTELLGVGPTWYWPPFLKINDRVRDAVKAAGINLYEPASIVVSMDYDNSVGADEIERRATSDVKDGAVILFHEWREETVDRLPSILNTLREQNCVFMTFSELDQALRKGREPAGI